MANNNFLQCPTDCGTPVFGAIPVEADCPSAIPRKSQICDLFIDAVYDAARDIATWDAAGITTWYGAHVDNAAIDNTKIKQLGMGAGSMADPTEDEVDLNKGRTVVTSTTRTLDYVINVIDDATYEFLRQIQCGKPARFWFQTYGGRFFGDLDGIHIQSASVVFNYGSANTDVESATLTLTFESKTDPRRIDSPL